MVWDIMLLLKLVGEKGCQFFILWNKIMNNLNLDVVIVRKFPVIDLRLRGKPMSQQHKLQELLLRHRKCCCDTFSLVIAWKFVATHKF